MAPPLRLALGALALLAAGCVARPIAAEAPREPAAARLAVTAGVARPAEPGADEADLDAFGRRLAAAGGSARALARELERDPERVARWLASEESTRDPILRSTVEALFERALGPERRALAELALRLEEGHDPELSARALALAARVRDPVLLARVLASRPAGAPWPEGPLRDAARAWRTAADRELVRSAPEDALRRIQAWSARALEPAAEQELRLALARALYLGGRTREARAVLASLEDPSSASLARRRAAMEGALAAEAGEHERALARLEAALAEGSAWPGAGRALADRAALQALLGRRDEARRDFEDAALVLEREQDAEGRLRLLANQSRCLRVWGDERGAELAAAARARLAREEGLERQAER